MGEHSDLFYDVLRQAMDFAKAEMERGARPSQAVLTLPAREYDEIVRELTVKDGHRGDLWMAGVLVNRYPPLTPQARS